METLIAALRDPARYPHAVARVELIETHISWVLIAGDYVYKIKKPVNFGFLDFSTLEKRRFYCEEELRLNSRWAPQIYLAVVPIIGTTDAPQLDGKGPAIEYALKMCRFDDSARLDRLLTAGKVTTAHIAAFASAVAAVHQNAPVAPVGNPHAATAHMTQPALDNFAHLQPLLRSAPDLALLEQIEHWTRDRCTMLVTHFADRACGGAVRECHGDLHTENLAWWNDQPLLFDCIEFSENLRWIDVMSDVAFLMMDLQYRGQPEFAQRFLNVYLEHSGDYAGLAVLRFFLAYRAMVRAKVAKLRATQSGVAPEITREHDALCTDYLRLAARYTAKTTPHLVLMFGLSGSGKSVAAQTLADHLGAIVLRSDIERKRLYGIAAHASSDSARGQGIYTASANDATYDALVRLTQVVLDAGYTAIVDATFLRAARRDEFLRLGNAHGIAVTIVQCHAPGDVLRQRIQQRVATALDPSEATLEVLEQQIARHDPLTAKELLRTVTIDTTAPWDAAEIAVRLAHRRTTAPS